jgi:hypothetical protein
MALQPISGLGLLFMTFRNLTLIDDPSVQAGEDISCLRPRGHCDQLQTENMFATKVDIICVVHNSIKIEVKFCIILHCVDNIITKFISCQKFA